MADSPNYTPDQIDQISLHQIASRVPLVVKEGKIVPENISAALKQLEEQNPNRADLQSRLKEIFDHNAKNISPVKSSESPPTQSKNFFMIDPHEMGVGLPYNFRVADRAKWETITSLIQGAGGSVSPMRGANEGGGLRETFTRDRYIVAGGVAFLPDAQTYKEIAVSSGIVSPEAAEAAAQSYDAEIRQAENFLKDHKVPVRKVDGAWFEGGNVIIDDRSRSIFMGLETDRDNSISAQKLGDAINTEMEKSGLHYRMLGVPLVNQALFYHLDLGMSDPLPKGGEVLISPHITDHETLETIKKRLGENRVIMLDQDEPVGTTNLIAPSEHTLVMTVATDGRIADLERRGYKIAQDPTFKDLTLAAGGVRCMTNTVPDTVMRPSVPSPSM